jgi:ribonuclease G
MRKEIIINSTANEIRIAITEDGRLAELFVETPEKERMVGDIYLGSVARVMPGIKAAFIDIGMKQDGFLHFSDIGRSLGDYSAMIGDEDIDDSEDDNDEDETGAPVTAPGELQKELNAPSQHPQQTHVPERRFRGREKLEHPELHLQKGHDIIVQVTKEPVAKKGVRVTTEVSLAGRFLVLLPFDGKVGVSKKLTNFREKRRLRRIVRSILPEGFGAIIRTVAEGKEEQDIKNDLESLINTWHEIEKTVKQERPPAILYKDMATTSSVIRDLFSNEVEHIVVDSKKLFRDIWAYVKWTSPSLLDKIDLYKEREPIFDKYGVEKEIATALSRKVWLKSGGYIIIDPTEAMVVIDVNSGRYAAKREQELNSLRTNLEAAREIVRQLRLRDMGGIIVIDFIDLEDDRNKKKVYDELRKEFRHDRAKVTVLPMTEFGLVQITRQRIRQSVLHSFTEPCPTCGGLGLVQSKATIVGQIERWIRRFKSETHEHRLILRVHPSIAEALTEGTIGRLKKIMLKFFIIVSLDTDKSLAIDEFHFISKKQNKDVTDQYMNA